MCGEELYTYLINIYHDMRYQRILEWAPKVVRHTEIRNPLVSRRILVLLGCKLNVYPDKQTGNFSFPACVVLGASVLAT